MMDLPLPQHRILIVGDRDEISEDLSRILTRESCHHRVDSKRPSVTLSDSGSCPADREILTTRHGQLSDGETAVEWTAGRRFALAFVDIDVSPDRTATESIRHLWNGDPDLQLACLTDCSDQSWNKITAAVGPSDRLLRVTLPFDPDAVEQLVMMAIARFTAEQDLSSQREKLEKIVDQRTRHLREACDVARAAHEAKGRFLASMSHEIRTPLNAVLGMSELLLDTTLTSEQREYALATQSSARTLLGHLNDVLDLSKLESHQLKIEERPFSLRLLVEETVTLMRPNATSKNLQLNCSIPDKLPPLIRSDATRIRQILTNLISNAIRFTPTGSVDVRVSVTSPASETVDLALHVSDTGVGIPAERIDTIFSAFVQSSDSTTRLFGGTGLGLAISRQLAELLGGSLTVASVPGEGATFTLQLEVAIAQSTETGAPAAPPDTAAERPIRDHPSAGGQIRVLLVDDHPFNRLFARRSLEKLNCSVAIADNGRQAVEMYRNQCFDLILMDCLMPVMDGYTATRAIRQLEGGGDRRIPVIALTAQTVENDRERCLAADMDDFVSKPLSIETLQKTVEQWTTRTHTEPA